MFCYCWLARCTSAVAHRRSQFRHCDFRLFVLDFEGLAPRGPETQQYVNVQRVAVVAVETKTVKDIASIQEAMYRTFQSFNARQQLFMQLIKLDGGSNEY